MAVLPGLQVVRSKIHGYGLVATRRFAAGEIVCYGDGVMYREGDVFDDTYALILPGYEPAPESAPGAEIGEAGFVEGAPLFWDLADQTRWINHACEPNTSIDSSWEPKAKQLSAWWVATRDIEIGEELTYDYGFTAACAEPCYCGTPGCRGVIVDDDPEELASLSDELKKKLTKPAALRAALAS